MTAREIRDAYETPRPEIRSGCYICRVSPEDLDLNRVIVSPSGMAHHADGDRTCCGHDATGPRWWWPL